MTDSLLLVVPAIALRTGSTVEIDEDFAHNVRLYAKRFGKVTIASPVFEEGDRSEIMRSVPLKSLPANAHFVELPASYREDRYLRAYRRIRALLRTLIADATHLAFSPHAAFDWAILATDIAIAERRKYCVEFDVDYIQGYDLLIRNAASPVQRLRLRARQRLFAREVRRGLRKSSVVLLQGEEVYNSHAPYAGNPQLIYNPQVDAGDHITDEALQAKIAQLGQGEPIQVVYGGQVNERKGASDWIAAVELALQSGVNLRAKWLGYGEKLDAMREEVRRRGLDGKVEFRGFQPRDKLFAALSASHVAMFCHKSAESARALVEALACGCALVGYDSSYPRGLVERLGGGSFVPQDDWRALAERLKQLDDDRPQLAALVSAAAATARTFDRDTFQDHRIGLIKQYAG